MAKNIGGFPESFRADIIKTMDLQGAHVLVTGASGGIGKALVAAFADRGAKLTITGRNQQTLTGLADRVGGTVIAADLTECGAPEQIMAAAGHVDVLIANAALPATGLLADYTIAELDRALDVNLRAPIVMAKLATAQMAARGSGHLVFISSLAGKSASGQSALYNATKFGIRGFASALRQDLRPHGVGVSTVFPGPIREAGMFAEANVKLPLGIGTRSPQEVAAATLRAIQKNIAEIDVAPLMLRFGALVGGVAPALAAAVERFSGSDAKWAQLAEGQRHMR